MPIGGYKGSGLNVAIGLLTGVMSGTAFGGSVIDHRVELDSPTNTDQSIFVLRPDLIMSESESFESVDDHLDELPRSGPDGVDVRLPGDRVGQVEADNIAKGVPVPSPLLGQLNGIASRLHV
jgi:LDH2 family malate/lactate/ureidoglycolate dehydrogenase